MKTAFILSTIVLCALVIILISELVKQGKEIDTLHIIVEDQDVMIAQLRGELQLQKDKDKYRHSQGGGGSKS